MTKEEIIQAISDDKMVSFIQPDQLAQIVAFVIENYQPSLPSNLDEAAKEYAKTTFKKPHSDNPDEEVTIVEPDKYAGFIAGAKWDKEQMLKEAVEGEFLYTPYPTIELDDSKDYNFKDFDKVRVIVLPKKD